MLKDLSRHLPESLQEKARQMEEYTRGFMTGGTLFEEMGFYYVGPIDGHNLDHLLPVLENVKKMQNGPVLVHVVTKKDMAMRLPKRLMINITACRNLMW